jgi:hypothetical protein
MKILAVLSASVIIAFGNWSANAQNIILPPPDFGPLASKDDPGSQDWLFFHCSYNGDSLLCEVAQTVISKQSCSVHQFLSQYDFHWNAETSSWIFREGPSGPCGAVNVGTLKKSGWDWTYSETDVVTNPSGTLPGLTTNSVSCDGLSGSIHFEGGAVTASCR